MAALRPRIDGFERVQLEERPKRVRASVGSGVGRGEQPPAEPLSRRKTLANAAFWSAGTSALAQLLSLIGNVVVARYLAPNQYGIAAMALVVVHFAAVFSSFGLTPAIVAGRISAPVAIRSAHWLISAVGLALCALIWAVSPLVGTFFHEPQVAVVLAAGHGSRLLPLTKNLAKPALPFVGVSILDRLLDALAAAVFDGGPEADGRFSETVAQTVGGAGIARDLGFACRHGSSH